MIQRFFINQVRRLINAETHPRKRALETIFEFVSTNHLAGDYLEFGSGGAHTFRWAYTAATANSVAPHLYSFDSFQGLPKPTGIDVHPDFSTGQFAQTQKEFRRRVQAHGVGSERYTVVSGFYNDTLTDRLRTTLPLKKAAVIWVDCDLYESAKTVLAWVRPYLQTGTVIAFDDYFCFNGDPDRGESRAKREFLAVHPDITLRSYFTFGSAGKAFICKVAAPPK